MRAFVAATCIILLAGATFVTFVVMSVFGPNLPYDAPTELRRASPVPAPPDPSSEARSAKEDRPPGYMTMQEKANRARAEADERRRQYWEHREWEKRLTICRGC